ncbi:hypothetical protein Pfo_004529 [Paulownia fortunei]|nr:hypothetical protein Pfo_004529 [Paulownia fortunei]
MLLNWANCKLACTNTCPPPPPTPNYASKTSPFLPSHFSSPLPTTKTTFYDQGFWIFLSNPFTLLFLFLLHKSFLEGLSYLSELLAEHNKLGPFMQVLPICSRLLNQSNLTGYWMMPNQSFSELERLRHRSPSPMASTNLLSNVARIGLASWNGLPQERLSGPRGMTMDWQRAPASPSCYTVKRILRLEIPVDNYPNFSSVEWLLGHRGNSLKHVEATAGCHVYIREKGSIKDPDKKLWGRPGCEHLNESLHILIEADLPANVDESQDFVKRQQLRELALPNSNLREESPGPSGSVSPFNTSGMKRAKTGC